MLDTYQTIAFLVHRRHHKRHKVSVGSHFLLLPEVNLPSTRRLFQHSYGPVRLLGGEGGRADIGRAALAGRLECGERLAYSGGSNSGPSSMSSIIYTVRITRAVELLHLNTEPTSTSDSSETGVVGRVAAELGRECSAAV